MEKIQFCGMKLQEWAGGISKEYKQNIMECRARMRKLRSRRDVQGVQLYNEEMWKYLNLLEK